MASDVPSKETALREFAEAFFEHEAAHADTTDVARVRRANKRLLAARVSARATLSQPSEPPQGEGEPARFAFASGYGINMLCAHCGKRWSEHLLRASQSGVFCPPAPAHPPQGEAEPERRAGLTQAEHREIALRDQLARAMGTEHETLEEAVSAASFTIRLSQGSAATLTSLPLDVWAPGGRARALAWAESRP